MIVQEADFASAPIPNPAQTDVALRRPWRLFISYAHKDDSFRQDLETHLKPLMRDGLLQIWSDRQIDAGREWKQSIHDKLETSDIILLLISPDFLASEFCVDIELKHAMARHKVGQALVIPVFLRPCEWRGSVFGKLQGVPDDAKPISRWEDRDEAFQAVARALHRAAEALTEDRARRTAEEKTRQEVEAKAKHEAEEQAKQAEERAHQTGERLQQETAARHTAEEQTRQEAEARQELEKRLIEAAKARDETEERAQRAEEQARQEAEARQELEKHLNEVNKARREAEGLAQQEAEAKRKAASLTFQLLGGKRILLWIAHHSFVSTITLALSISCPAVAVLVWSRHEVLPASIAMLEQRVQQEAAARQAAEEQTRQESEARRAAEERARQLDERVQQEVAARQIAEQRAQQEATARQAADQRTQEEVASRRVAEERVQQEATARRATEQQAQQEATAKQTPEEQAQEEQAQQEITTSALPGRQNDTVAAVPSSAGEPAQPIEARPDAPMIARNVPLPRPLPKEERSWNNVTEANTPDAYRSYLESYPQGAHAVQAQLNLGIMYQTGRGVPQDDAQAVQWYRKAADQGNATAQNNLRAMCTRGVKQACS